MPFRMVERHDETPAFRAVPESDHGGKLGGRQRQRSQRNVLDSSAASAQEHKTFTVGRGLTEKSCSPSSSAQPSSTSTRSTSGFNPSVLAGLQIASMQQDASAGSQTQVLKSEVSSAKDDWGAIRLGNVREPAREDPAAGALIPGASRGGVVGGIIYGNVMGADEVDDAVRDAGVDGSTILHHGNVVTPTGHRGAAGSGGGHGGPLACDNPIKKSSIMVKFPKRNQGLSGQMEKHVQEDDEDTVPSSGSDEDQKMAGLSGSKLKKRKNRLTKISALYDLDGDGVLDEVEQAMRDRDVNNDGDLSPDEIYELVKDQLAIRKRRGQARILVAGLLCFVFMLAASSLGTSWAAAVLAKDVAADDGGPEGVAVMRDVITNHIAASSP
ncbi:hypothetical protein THAOC_26480, partial [Thalassiosira oceanica]